MAASNPAYSGSAKSGELLSITPRFCELTLKA